MANRIIARNARPDLSAILGQFSDARAIIECVARLLEDWDYYRSGPADEAVCLRHGLDRLSTAYDELDRAIAAMRP
jgi:hypothetical protein